MTVNERDGFSARNAGSAIAFGGKKVLIFGGQDSVAEKMFDELYCLDLETNSMKLILEDVGKEDVIVPKPRNSHTFTKLDEQIAYLFGGAD